MNRILSRHQTRKASALGLPLWFLVGICCAPVPLFGAGASDIFRSGFDALSSVRYTVVDSDAYALWHTNTARHRSDVFVEYGGELYFAYYRSDEQLIIARSSDTIEWELLETGLTANAGDPHNTPNIAIDGNGLIHVIWDVHSNSLRYATVGPGGTHIIDFLTGNNESAVTYPSFFRLSDGDLLLLYRSGSSGNGDVIVKRYDTESGTWADMASPAIAGEGDRNPYWQAYLAPNDQLHLSWTWRERLPSNRGFESNRDLCFSRYSAKENLWFDSTDNVAAPPVSASDCDLIAAVPANSTLANNTAILVTAAGANVTATFWRTATDNTPRIHLVHNSPDRRQWVVTPLNTRPMVTGLESDGASLARPALLEVNGQWGVFQRDSVASNRAYLDLIEPDTLSRTKRVYLSSGDMGLWEPHVTRFRGKIVVLMQQQNFRIEKGRSIQAATPLALAVLQ